MGDSDNSDDERNRENWDSFHRAAVAFTPDDDPREDSKESSADTKESDKDD